VFELGSHSEEKFFFVGTGDKLDIDGETFGGAAHRERDTGEAGEIEPLAEAHGVAIVVRLAGRVVPGAVMEGGFGGHGGKQDGRVAELAENGGADLIAIGTGFLEGFESNRGIGCSGLEIMPEHRAESRFVALGIAAE